MKLLYIGHAHPINDPRLLHRQMKLLHNNRNDIEFWFLKFEQVSKATVAQNNGKPLIHVSQKAIAGISVNLIVVQADQRSPFGIRGQFFNKLHAAIIDAIEHVFAGSRVDVIQASDVREIRFAIQLGKRLGSTLIYDSHEDYIRQIIDYRKHILQKYIWAAIFFLVEMRWVRQFDYVFCTDEYLLHKYPQPIYAAKSVSLLRNYPLVPSHLGQPRSYDDTQTLHLVYIGGVNEHRGVIETAHYVRRFNRESEERKLEFTIYSPDNRIVQHLVANYDINHIPWIDYSDLMAALHCYDVGICLWLPIKKFHRNLPLKNFDYMAQGLPIVTSNFGNLTKYIRLSGAGVCIDPQSYTEFKEAIAPMFDGAYRRRLGENGLAWVRREGDFQREGHHYVEVITGSSSLN